MIRLTDEEIANKLDGAFPSTNPESIDDYRELMRKSLRFIAKVQLKKLGDEWDNVYSLDIVEGLEFGQPVDFGRMQVRTEDEIFMEAVANAFKEGLEQPLSTQHFSVIERALSEPTNENIETVRQMLGIQRKASQYS